MPKPLEPPPRRPCRCAYFCIEQTEASGRYCKVDYKDYFEAQKKKEEKGGRSNPTRTA
jgi:hypothetical protein